MPFVVHFPLPSSVLSVQYSVASLERILSVPLCARVGCCGSAGGGWGTLGCESSCSASPRMSISGLFTSHTVDAHSRGIVDSLPSAPHHEPAVVAVVSQSRPIITASGIARRASPRAKTNAASASIAGFHHIVNSAFASSHVASDDALRGPPAAAKYRVRSARMNVSTVTAPASVRNAYPGFGASSSGYAPL